MKIRKYKLDDAGNGQTFICNQVLYNNRSKFQKIEVADLELLGRVLVLDDIIQLSELDCDIYHESFAHIPMSFVRQPVKVLILGGGDGILAKELLKYNQLQIDLVDIDEKVCDVSKKYLSKLNNNALQDKRVKVYNQDALEFCKVTTSKYDVIFGDITDPHPNSPSASLLSDSSLTRYKSLLNKEGVLAIQTDNLQIAPSHVLNVSNKLQKHFSNANNFSIAAITLGGLFSFVCVSDSDQIRSKINVPTNWLNEEKVKTNFLLNNYLV